MTTSPASKAIVWFFYTLIMAEFSPPFVFYATSKFCVPPANWDVIMQFFGVSTVALLGFGILTCVVGDRLLSRGFDSKWGFYLLCVVVSLSISVFLMHLQYRLLKVPDFWNGWINYGGGFLSLFAASLFKKLEYAENVSDYVD